MYKLKKTRKPIQLLTILFVLLTVILSCVMIGCGSSKTVNNETYTTENAIQEEIKITQPSVGEEPVQVPWDEAGSKQPIDYTWEEYENLTVIQKQEFRNYLGKDGYGVWLDNMRAYVDVMPWDEHGAKQPTEYSWAEFELLTSAQQIAFQRYLGLDEFITWLDRVQSQMEALPWDEFGAKKPEEYTMEEFENLTASKQILFQHCLGAKGFAEWINAVQSESESNPWDQPGAKQPEEYTWVEFNALTAAQQMSFQNYLGIVDFDAWLSQNQPQSQLEISTPWDQPGAKQPEDYTWEEFNALTAAQQMAFQKFLGEVGFEEWLNMQEIS